MTTETKLACGCYAEWTGHDWVVSAVSFLCDHIQGAHVDGAPTANERDLRLVAPRLTDAEVTFLLELHKLDEKSIAVAMQDLNHALRHNDVEAGLRAAFRFSSAGALMEIAAKKAIGAAE